MPGDVGIAAGLQRTGQRSERPVPADHRLGHAGHQQPVADGRRPQRLSVPCPTPLPVRAGDPLAGPADQRTGIVAGRWIMVRRCLCAALRTPRIVQQRFRQIPAVGDPIASAVIPADDLRNLPLGRDAQTQPVAVLVADQRQRVGQHETGPDRALGRLDELVGLQGITELRLAWLPPDSVVEPARQLRWQLEAVPLFDFFRPGPGHRYRFTSRQRSPADSPRDRRAADKVYTEFPDPAAPAPRTNTPPSMPTRPRATCPGST